MWWAITVIIGLSLEIYCVTNGKQFELKDYGLGAGALLALGGIGKKFGG